MSKQSKEKNPYGSIKFKTIDEYHSAFPKNVREQLDTLRRSIKQAAPQAEEVISYNMPAFKLYGILVYYAAHKEHVGFYPTASPMIEFQDDLKKYKTSRGTVQFPFDKKIPITLIKKIVKFRVNERQNKLLKKTK